MNSDSPDAEISAERVVEHAAFLKLAAVRGTDVTLFAGYDDRTTDPSFQSLVDDCPLTESSSVEILGQIHEFLLAIRGARTTTSARRKSTVRTANGVVYSPACVTDYMVNQTIGERIRAITPDEVEKLTILDPAMGCGAFLLSACRHLIAWHVEWYVAHQPDKWPDDVTQTAQGWRLTFRRCVSIFQNNLYGVDLDRDAIEVARRTLWLTVFELSAPANANSFGDFNLKQGHALIGPAFGESFDEGAVSVSVPIFSWTNAFPQVAARGGFDIVIGNPPYRRERNFKRELDEIGATPLSRHRAPRMDLWYYFVHRGIELLNNGGTLSYITNAYWLRGTGASKLIAALRDDVSLDELFLLRNQPVFAGVQGQHLIFRLTKSVRNQQTTIKIASRSGASSSADAFVDLTNVRSFVKDREQLFRDGRLDAWPPADSLLNKLVAFPRLIELGIVRQGIAENPATINRRTLERFEEAASEAHWQVGEGVFSLTVGEAAQLALGPGETELLRPYHDLCDIGRYWRAATPSRRLIYSTRSTCPEITEYPALQRHLARFRVLLDARRETRSGSNRWWHLHWPRDARLWQVNKLVVLQLAIRPSFVPAFQPTFVPFSANVFVPGAATGENLMYLCAVLNSRVLWAWFSRHAKHRGIGLDLNGHVLAQAPIRRIDFANPHDVARHDELVRLVDQRLKSEQQYVAASAADRSAFADVIQSLEVHLDTIVASLYGLDPTDIEFVNDITVGERE